MKTCIIIPNYNHGDTLDTVLTQLTPYHLPCIIIDDGSNAKNKLKINAAVKKFSQTYLITLDHNQGKGAAVIAGLDEAHQQGFTHALQFDADGQHNSADIALFLKQSQQHPEALISGQPIYDESIPKSRLYGRQVTHFWVTLETLSRTIKDTMCGFRVYPIQPTRQIIASCPIGKRMDFDIEIMVRLFWEHVLIIFIPTKVDYPEQGLSHFKLWRDNVSIAWMHTRLFFGMLRRFPKLIRRKIHNPNQNQHWSTFQEAGTRAGIRCMLLSYRLLGRTLTHGLLYPVITYFYLVGTSARRASKQYLKNLKMDQSSFQHFMQFGYAVLDKFAVWNNDIALEDIDFPKQHVLRKRAAAKQGGVILTAHLGNIEIARALSRLIPDVKINALVFNQHALNINAILQQVNPAFTLNMIDVQKMDIPLAIQLKERIDAGEFVVIMGDRTSTSVPQRAVKVAFLGKEAYLPQGSFILASLLQCPIYFMLCLKQDTSAYTIALEEFPEPSDAQKQNRQAKLTFYAQTYADWLMHYCQHYPLQWFNFFNFWQKPRTHDDNPNAS